MLSTTEKPLRCIVGLHGVRIIRGTVVELEDGKLLGFIGNTMPYEAVKDILSSRTSKFGRATVT